MSNYCLRSDACLLDPIFHCHYRGCQPSDRTHTHDPTKSTELFEQPNTTRWIIHPISALNTPNTPNYYITNGTQNTFFLKKIICPLSKSSCGHEFWRPLFWVSGVQKTTETNSIVHGQLAIVQRFKKMCHFVEPRSVPENLTTVRQWELSYRTRMQSHLDDQLLTTHLNTLS